MKAKKVPFSIFQATLENVDEIESLLYPAYFEESGYSNLDYDETNCKAMIAGWITDGVGIIMRSQGKIVAFASMGFMRTFYKQVEADVDMFFILPEYRGTGIARALSTTISNVAKEGNAEVVYTSCLSELGGKNNQLYINLWKKLGFRELGTVMIRS
jgi:ribosomal protein S18 acetylase RimI-like enzyme